MKKLTKEQVYVLIDNQPDCDRAIEILTKAVEPMWKDSTAFLLKEDKRYLKTYEDMDWGISYDNEDRTRVTLDELERILMPKIKKAELLERIEKLEEYVKELIDNPKVTVVHPPTWANDPGTVIGKGTIEIEEENPLEKITGVNESVEAIKNMLLRKGVLTEQDFDAHFAIQQYGTDNTYPTRNIIIDTIEAEKPAFEVGKVYKDGLAMFYCTRIEDGKPFGFGFDLIGQWWEDDGDFWAGDFTEATPEEWFSRLEEEAKKKYPKGCKVKCLHNSIYNKIDTLNFTGYHSDTGCLRHKDSNNFVCCVMQDGKWAEIIEEPQYQAGTLGAFWDGEWEDAVCKRIAYLGTLEGKTKCDQFILKEANMCYLNFKPLKFD